MPSRISPQISSPSSTSVPAKVLLDVAESGVWPAFEPYPVPEITPELDKAEFKVVASSEQNDGKIGNAFDGSPETIWHSNWSDASVAHPYTIDIDVGKLAALNGFGYLPRENYGNGSIKDYEIYVSRAPGAFGETDNGVMLIAAFWYLRAKKNEPRGGSSER